MNVFRSYKEVTSEFTSSALTLGNFDGLHLGHQKILNTLHQVSNELTTPKIVYTFDPHTHYKIRNINAYITPTWYKLELLEKMGIDAVIVESFSEEFQATPKEIFLQAILHDHLKIKAMVTGNDVRFGQGGKGGIDDLYQFCKTHNIKYTSVDPHIVNSQKISSTHIRTLIESGNIKQLNTLLGRNFSIKGQVHKGHQRGKELGFPTANVLFEPFVLPKDGVYSCKIIANGKTFTGATSIGTNPTFKDEFRVLETFILDFNDNLYGNFITIEFLEFIRNQLVFKNEADLINQIAKDVQLIRGQIGNDL